MCVAAIDFSAINKSVIGVSALSTSSAPSSPQFHLSLVGTSKTDAKVVDYTVDWITSADVTNSQLIYGTSADAMATQVDAKLGGLVEESKGESVKCWSAVVRNVAPGTTIFYALADNAAAAGSSAPNSFTVPKDTFTWAVFGDIGAPMQKQASGVALPALKNALEKDKAYHGILNIGDLGYELVGANGKNYMDEFESITSKVPMQTTVGNHEYQYGAAPDFALRNYYRRFAGLTLGAGTVSGSYSNEFYSFKSGLVHFAVINTEVYGDEAFVALQADGVTWKADEDARKTVGSAQATWLAYDLSRVDRSVTPYIIVCGHRPPFKTPGPLSAPNNRFTKEIIPVMSKYQVDLYLAGHEHTYLVFDASVVDGFNVPPIIISGSPGNNEFIREEKDLKIVGFKWKTLIPKYGYGYLTATEDQLNWQWGTAASDGTHSPKSMMWELQDEMTFPRQKSFAPSTPEGTPIKTPSDLADVWSGSQTNGTWIYRAPMALNDLAVV
uniref:Purple acid phosphatase n=1 Tax=Globisporangium ultimum (strain ATCC 200006 / CBS 805.95 / DAOM BR144) TaxID=431595 RepID=K3X8L0_GLOUD